MSKVAPDPTTPAEREGVLPPIRVKLLPPLNPPMTGQKIEKSMRGSGGEGNRLISPYPPPPFVGDLDVVEFAGVEYLCFESDKMIEMQIARRGPCTRRIEVVWENEDINVGPQSFVAQRGLAVLEPGQKLVAISLRVHDNVAFNVEALFDVALEFKDPFQTAAVMGDLVRSRVVVLNDDVFPHGEERIMELPFVILGFLKHNYYLFQSDVHWGFFFRLFPGLSFVAGQFITKYLIKTVSYAYVIQSHNDGEVPDAYQLYVAALGAAYLVNFVVSSWADLSFTKLKLGGKATRALRCACMDTVSQLTPVGEEEFDVGRVMKIADVQVDAAIGTSWMACFSLFANSVKLLCMIVFLVFTAIEQAQLNDAPSLYLLIAIPFLMITLDAVLMAYTIEAAANKSLAAMEADDAWSSFMAGASFMRQVITTYRKGFMVTKKFEEVHKAFNGKAFQAAMYTKRTQIMANTITAVIAAFIMVTVGGAVARGDMGVASFVVFMSTINGFGPTIGSVFGELFNIGKGFASIQKLGNLLNADTRRKQLLRGQKRRAGLLGKYKAGLPPDQPFDPDALIMHQVTYLFKAQTESALPPLECNMDGCQVVALKGGGSVGKKVILRLIARHFIPSTGFILYPTRWRMRFMDANALFFGGDMNVLAMAALQGDAELAKAKRESMGTLEYNLKFGAQFKHPNHAVWDEEIFALLNLLNVSKDLIGGTVDEWCKGPNAKKYTLIGLNGEKLSLTNRALLTIARALLSSVDLILISNVLDILGPDQAIHVMGILKELTEKRGISVLKTENSSTPLHLKKKKTVIFSTKLAQLDAMADNYMMLGGDDAGDEEAAEDAPAPWHVTKLGMGGLIDPSTGKMVPLENGDFSDI